MLSIGAIPDDVFDVLINSAIDRMYTGSSAQPGDSELLRHGGMRPGEEPQRPVGHRNEWVRDEIDRDERGIPDWVIADGYPAEEGTGVDMRARMESQWREPDEETLEAILSNLEGGGDMSPNDAMLMEQTRVDGIDQYDQEGGNYQERWEDLNDPPYDEMYFPEEFNDTRNSLPYNDRRGIDMLAQLMQGFKETTAPYRAPGVRNVPGQSLDGIIRQLLQQGQPRTGTDREANKHYRVPTQGGQPDEDYY